MRNRMRARSTCAYGTSSGPSRPWIGQIIRLEFQLRQVPVKGAQSNLAAASILDGSDYFAANQVLEGRAPQIPHNGDDGRQQQDADPRPNPEAGVRAPGFGFFGHYQKAPEALGSSAGGLSAGIGTLD